MLVKNRDFALNIVGLEATKTPLLWLHHSGGRRLFFCIEANGPIA